MLSFFRAFAKSPIAVGMMGLLIVAFAIWGVRDAFHVNISNAVVKAGSHEVSAVEYKSIFDRVVREEEQRQGRGIPREEAVAAGIDRSILRDMADTNAIAELTKRIGVRPADKLVLADIAKNPNFANPLTGRFSEKQYQQVLAMNDIIPDVFVADMTDQLAERHLASGLGAGTRAPRIYAAMMASYLMENRSADFVVLTPGSVPKVNPPTDADLRKFMQENAAQLKQPEFRTVSLVRFSAQAIAQTLPVDQAALQKAFDAEKDRLSTPERRAFTQLLFKDAASAAAAVARLNKGENPAAVAKALNGAATAYPATSERAIPDPKVAQAVFALQPGQTSAPVQSEFGFAVIKLAAITPAKPAALDEVRSKLETEIKARDAQDKVYDVVQKYSDAHDSGAPLAKAAEVAGVKVYTLGPLTAQGVLRDTGAKEPSLNQKMLSEAFSLPQGGETEVQDLGKGEYYALRVDNVTPSALPDLDKIRAPLAQRYMLTELAKRMQARATEISDRVGKGEPVDKIAAAMNLKVQHVSGISRATARQHAELGQEFLGKLLEAKPGEAFIARVGAPGGAFGVAVGKIGPAVPGPVADVARAAVQGRAQVDQMVMNDFGETLRDIARERIKPRINEQKARQAIGLAADDAAAASGAKPAAPAKAK